MSAPLSEISAQNAHTLGPWVAREQKSKQGASLGWIVEHSCGRIAWSSFATEKPNEGEGPPYTIGGANARLIAAAPDMYEALQYALKELTACKDLGMSLNRSIELATAAIAKAEGRP